MKLKLFANYIILGILILQGCKKDDAFEILDKEIRLAFPFEYTYSADTVYTLPYVFSHLKDFDKRNYTDLDSIYFVCAISTASGMDTAQARLFDITNGTSIIGSELTQSTNDPFMHEWRISENLIDKLPSANIDIAIQLKVNHGYSYLRGAYLILKRK